MPEGIGVIVCRAMEKKLSIIFGLLIGVMWMGEILLGNLGGTSVFGNLRDVHPRVYAIADWCALGAVGLAGMGGCTVLSLFAFRGYVMLPVVPSVVCHLLVLTTAVWMVVYLLRTRVKQAFGAFTSTLQSF